MGNVAVAVGELKKLGFLLGFLPDRSKLPFCFILLPLSMRFSLNEKKLITILLTAIQKDDDLWAVVILEVILFSLARSDGNGKSCQLCCLDLLGGVL